MSSENCEIKVKQELQSEDDYGPAAEEDIRVLDQFCRLCLRTGTDFVSLISYVQGFPISHVFHSITGFELVLEDTLPSKVCQTCFNMLEKGFNIRQSFIESYRLLESFNSSQERSLIDRLSEFQNDTDKHPKITNPETVPCVSIPINIKQEPELDLEPEELPEPEPSKSTLTNKVVKKRVNNRYNCKIKRAKLDPNKCYICEQMHENPENLNTHLSTHAEMIPYQCEECKESDRPVKLTSLIMLHKHFRMHASAIKCAKCPIRTNTMAAMYGHMQIYHGENSDTEYTCQLCGEKLISKIALGRHMRFHKARDEGRYTCSFCQTRFATKPHLTRHERIHTNERPFQCHYCPKSYKTQSVRNLHERKHTGEKGFHCEICGKRFRLRSILNSHIAAVHGERKEPEGPQPLLECDFEGCSYSTTKKGAFYNHKAIHEPKFQCSLCPKKFPTGQRLEIHQFVHTGVKKFQCHLCSKQFLSKLNLDAHVETHTNTTPFTCELCGKEFLRQRSYKQHLVRHTNLTMNFECGYCGKKFRYRGELVRHEKTHEKAANREKLTILENDNAQSTVPDREKMTSLENYNEQSIVTVKEEVE